MAPGGTAQDSELRSAVLHELEWAPSIDHVGIGVAVEAGAVALSGEVDDYPERLAARNAALGVQGVQVVVDQIIVHSSYSDIPTPLDIAKAVHTSLRLIDLPSTVKAVVDGGTVTLVGEVEWAHQLKAAEDAVRRVHGVREVDDRIVVVPAARSVDDGRRG